MQGISSSTAPTTMSAPVSARDAIQVSVLRAEQDQERKEGEAQQKLIASAAEVQMTGKGGNVDAMG